MAPTTTRRTLWVFDPQDSDNRYMATVLPQLELFDPDAFIARPPVRVLHVINGEHYAGAERVQDLLASRLPELGFEVGFACMKPRLFPELRRATARRSTTWACARNWTSVRSGGWPSLSSARTTRWCTRTRPARPWSAGWRPAWRGCRWCITCIAQPRPIRRTCCAIGSTRSANVSRCAALGPWWPFRRAWPSTRGESALSPWPVRVVPNGVPMRGSLAQRSLPTSPWRLGTVALFRPRKGLEVLLDALAMLMAQGRQVQLQAVGTFETPQYERAIHRRVAELGIRSAVQWRGFQPDVDAELATMDLLLLPSLFGEGLPMVVLEAMAAGVPVVATRVAGVPEAIRHGVDGLIAEPGNAAQLAAMVRQVMDGQANWSAMRGPRLPPAARSVLRSAHGPGRGPAVPRDS